MLKNGGDGNVEAAPGVAGPDIASCRGTCERNRLGLRDRFLLRGVQSIAAWSVARRRREARRCGRSRWRPRLPQPARAVPYVISVPNHSGSIDCQSRSGASAGRQLQLLEVVGEQHLRRAACRQRRHRPRRQCRRRNAGEAVCLRRVRNGRMAAAAVKLCSQDPTNCCLRRSGLEIRPLLVSEQVLQLRR